MVNKFFAILLILTIGFYSCQKEEENKISVAGSSDTKASNEAKETLEKIINFREKLLRNGFERGESLETNEAVILMTSSLNATYAQETAGKNVEEKKFSINVNFGTQISTYENILKAYGDVLSLVRQHYEDLEGEEKSFTSVFLNFDTSNGILEIKSSIATDYYYDYYDHVELVVDVQMSEIESVINENEYKPSVFIYHGEQEVLTFTDSPGTLYVDFFPEYFSTYYLFNHLFFSLYSVPTGSTCKKRVTTDGEPEYNFGDFDENYYAEETGIPELYLLINEERLSFPWNSTYLFLKTCENNAMFGFVDGTSGLAKIALQAVKLTFAKKISKYGPNYNYEEDLQSININIDF